MCVRAVAEGYGKRAGFTSNGFISTEFVKSGDSGMAAFGYAPERCDDRNAEWLKA